MSEPTPIPVPEDQMCKDFHKMLGSHVDSMVLALGTFQTAEEAKQAQVTMTTNMKNTAKIYGIVAESEDNDVLRQYVKVVTTEIDKTAQKLNSVQVPAST